MARAEVIRIPVELNITDIMKGLLESVAALVYAVKTGEPVDFGGGTVPDFIQHLMEQDPEAIQELIRDKLSGV